MTITSYGKQYHISFKRGSYINNKSLAIDVLYFDMEFNCLMPFSTLTVNLAIPPLESNRAYVDINNCPKEIIQNLVIEGKASYTGIDQQSGYVVYPCYEFNQEWLDSLDTIK